ncbi:flippase [Candidatus Woesearchaeota archaeon]|jgi:O-antigen/teichoic acid export membrane protein|nr:flippase [Candidatus Woesearchaeota archaeon]MBT3538425.1 flippase [Candidatus Woesearchaeota archaeon]MBT4696875.1 flippase [Candidatus Woesearchaeota archaeon]MBT7106119.1 flippase [Candidatus Woesearchaeota archaeon]MBT7930983.1 flippase [Candidatus Woesearchaeota archaeon]
MKKKNRNLKSLKELTQAAGVFLIFSVVSYFILFFFRLLAARYFGAEDFGLFSLAETILLVVVLFVSLGIPSGIARYIPHYLYKKELGKLKGYLYFIVSIPLIFSFIVAFFIWIYSKQITIFLGYPVIFETILKIIAIALPFKIIMSLLRKIFVARKLVIYKLISYSVVEVGFLFLSILVIMFFKLSILWLIVAMLFSILLTTAYCGYEYKIRVKWNLPAKRKYELKSWLYFSLPLLFSGIFAYFVRWSDNLMIGKFMDPTDLGIYSVAFSLAAFLTFFQQSFSLLFIPLISEAKAKKKDDEISFLFKKSAAWIFGLSFPIFLVMVVFSKQILNLLYGADYVGGALPLIIIAFGMLINLGTGLGSKILILHKKTMYLFLINCFFALFNIALNIILIPIMGIVGAAIASATTLALINLSFLWVARRYEKLNLDLVSNFKFIIAGIVSVFLASRLSLLPINEIVLLFLSGVSYVVLYLILLLMFRTFKKEDFQMLLWMEKKFKINLDPLKKIVKKFY